MGLFCSVIHLRTVTRQAVLAALDEVLAASGFPERQEGPLPGRPESSDEFDWLRPERPFYLVSSDGGSWTTIIEASFAVDGVPWIAEVSSALSKRLACYALCLVVHDDDVFFYNLDHNGEAIDGYNSCPQYFEQETLSEEKVEEQRHTPAALAPILPMGVSVEALDELLNRGWWKAYDSGELDEHGVPVTENEFLGCEGNRMTQFAELLHLHGSTGTYPYTTWLGSEIVDWTGFAAVSYRTRGDGNG